MQHIKYIDVAHQLTHIDEIIAQSLKDKRLNIAELNSKCEKFKTVLQKRPSLKDARYVVYSKYMTEHHDEEMFLFLNKKGDTVDTVHGNEFWLYGMINLCDTIEDNILKEK